MKSVALKRRLSERQERRHLAERVVDQNSASWNHVSLWLRQVAGLRQVA